MNTSRKRGATLSLVAGLALILTLLGVAFFFFSKLVGGHRELEHATDSGNLNVAKQSVRSPDLKVFPTPGFNGPYDITDPTILYEVQHNFSELADPSNQQIDLLVYDRLVAQCFIVALNAAADNGGVNPNPLGIARAQQLIQVLDDPNNGVGVSLARKLKGDAALDTNFSALAAINDVRMLKNQEQTTSVNADRDISFMVRGNASNVVVNPLVIPPPFTLANLTSAGDFVNKNGNPYFVGYTPLNVVSTDGTIVTDNADHTVMAVPLRPGQEPHLVNDIDFKNLQPSPLAGSDALVHTRIPPNAFQSGGFATDGRTILANSAVSCAIAGSLQATFPVSVPNGFIVIANGKANIPTSPSPITFGAGPQCLNTGILTGQTTDVFSGALMEGVYVSTQNISAAGYVVSFDVDCIPNFLQNNYNHMQQFGTPLHDTELANAVACMYGTFNGNSASTALTDIETAALGLSLNAQPFSGDQDRCTNMNAVPGDPNADPFCLASFPGLEKLFGGISGGNNSQTACLSALDSFEEVVMAARAQDGGISIPFPNPYSTCTGATTTPLAYAGSNASGSNTFDLANIQTGAPTLNTLIGVSGDFQQYGSSGIPGAGTTASQAQAIYNDIVQRLQEIKPTVTAPEIATLFNQPIPTSAAGTVRFIWLDTSNQSNPVFRFTDAAGLPSRINPNKIVIDGTSVLSTTGALPLVANTGSGGLVDTDGDGGYPHPFDCAPFGQGESTTSFVWTPSSGTDGCMGMADLYNCVNTFGAMNFDCPC